MNFSLPVYYDFEDDSMLTRRFGKEAFNYFSGSPLNRVSFLRDDHSFLSQALKHPSASFLLLKQLQPLLTSDEKLTFHRYSEVQSVIGNDPYTFTHEEVIKGYDSRVTNPLLVFLGLDQRQEEKTQSAGQDSGSNSIDSSKERFNYKNRYHGKPYFALDVTPAGSYKAKAEELIAKLEAQNLSFSTERVPLKLTSNQGTAAMFAQARHVMDWNSRNQFCSQCGHRTLSVNGGFKRVCPPTDLAFPDAEPRECQTRPSVSNVSFPRTDPTMIAAIVSADGKRVLLGRQRRYPAGWYSVLAGFIEPGESVEDAVRREVWEESGVKVGRVVIHSTQPWPFPANLMIGAIGQALPDGEEIHLGHDKELENAKWVDVDEVKLALQRSHDMTLSNEQKDEEGALPLRVPPKTAIANRLMTAVVEGFVHGDSKM